MNMPKILLAGSGEKAQYMVHDFNDNTIRFIIHYPGLVDADILCAATKALVESVDILHSSFLTDKIGAYWHMNREYDESCYFQFVETDGDTAVTACSLSLLPISPENHTQLRCCLVQNSESSSVVLNISHLCVDGGDGKYLLGKLVEAYRLILDCGSAEALSVKNGSRAAEQVYENVTPKEFLSLMKNPISTVKSAFPYPTETPGRLRMVNTVISAPVMSAARKRAKSADATVNDLLLAACYCAYASQPGVDATSPMSIMSMMDLRRHCNNGESEGLCNMSGSLPTTLSAGVTGCFADTLADIAKQTRAAKENPLAGMEGLPLLHGFSHTLPMGLLLLIAGKIYGNMSIGLTNLGNLSADALALGNLLPSGGAFGGPLKKKPAMQISAISINGACTLCIVGKYTQEDSHALQSMLDRIADIIAGYANEELKSTPSCIKMEL